MSSTQPKILHRALTDPKSAQVKYRPVVQLGTNLPAMPNPSRPDYIYCRDWWMEQLRRCTEGWVCDDDNVFINPLYYFYLNFVKVPITDELRGGHHGWSSPYFRDGDKEYFDAVYYNMAYKKYDSEGNEINFNAKNLVVAKGRRKGWTTAELFGITQWFLLFMQGTSIGRAYPDDKTKNKERHQFAACYAQTHEFFKRTDDDEEIDLLTNNEDQLTQWTYTSSTKTTGGNKTVTKTKKQPVNSINFFTVNAKGSGVRGDKLALIIVVAAGMHTHLKEFYAAAEETLKLGSYKFGMLLVGGTSDAINNDSPDYKIMYYNPKSYNATRVFTPAWKCYQGAIDYFTGKSLREKSLPLIIKERAEKEANGEYEGLRLLIQEHPISPEEAFIPKGHSEYDAIKIDRQIMSILRAGMDNEWVRGRLEWEKDVYGERTGKVYFEKDAGGLWMILENYGVPITTVDNLYIAGIDDVYKDKAPHSTSKNAMVIYMKESLYVDGMSDMPVAFYLGRHPNRMMDYQEFHKGTVYYNSMVMYEHNDSAGYIGYAREAGIQNKFIYHNGQIGVRLGTDTKADITLLGLKWFADDRHERVLHSTLMESFKYWDSEINNDISSAFHLVFFGLEKTKKLGTKEVPKQNEAETPFRFGTMVPAGFPQIQTDVKYFKFGTLNQN